MTAKEKAKELYVKYAMMWHESTKDVKKCSLICVDEIISSIYNYSNYEMTPENVNKEVKYWQEVKTEIEKL